MLSRTFQKNLLKVLRRNLIKDGKKEKSKSIKEDANKESS